MQIVPKAAPSLASENNSASANSAQSAKARAMAILTGGNQAPVANQSAITPEEAVSTSSVESAQPDTIEAAVTEKVETKEEPISPQLAMLARKEKAIRQQAQQIKSEREAIKAKEIELERSFQAKLADAEKSWKAKLQENPLDEQYGLSYDTLTEKLLNSPKPEDAATQAYIKKLEARLGDFESKLDKQAKSFEDNQTAQYQQALSQIKSDATALVKSNPEFETIASTGSVGDVVDLIEKTFKADGVLLTVEEAAQAVEDHLLEEYTKLFQKTTKLQKRFQPAPSAAKPDTSKQLAESSKQSQPSKTLTNNMATSRPLTPRERALLAFEGRLKS